jgi:hypothetical protein
MSKKVDFKKLYEIKDLKVILPKREGETQSEEKKRKELNTQIKEKGFIPPPTKKTPDLKYSLYRLLVSNANKLQFQLAIEDYLIKICPIIEKSTRQDLINSRREILRSEGINLTYYTLIEGLERGIKKENLKYIARVGKDRTQPPYGKYIEYNKPIPSPIEQKAIRIMVDKRYSAILREIPPTKHIGELVDNLRDLLVKQVVNLQIAFPQLIDKYGIKDIEIIAELIKAKLPERQIIPRQEIEGLNKEEAIDFYKKTPELAQFLKAIDENKYKLTWSDNKKEKRKIEIDRDLREKREIIERDRQRQIEEQDRNRELRWEILRKE